MPSAAVGACNSNLERVDDILSFHDKELNPAVGPPPGRDRSLVLGAVVLLYAAWEAYVEQVAVELTDFLAGHLAPANVPASVTDALAAQSKPWDLAGDGWRTEWKAMVKKKAVGSGGTGDFGLNTAGPGQIIGLFALVGVDPFGAVNWQNMSTAAVKTKISALVRDRSEIAHTAQVPAGLGLNTARTYRDFVARLVEKFDEKLGTKGAALAPAAPW